MIWIPDLPLVVRNDDFILGELITGCLKSKSL
jgi:hypothetical protein